jgi:hypothetical protein
MDRDYYQAKPDPTVGLTRLATLIKAARGECPNTLLFDNGDFMQRYPLAGCLVTSVANGNCIRLCEGMMRRSLPAIAFSAGPRNSL